MSTQAPILLAVETSDAYSSVALSNLGKIWLRESVVHNDHAEVLTSMIEGVLDEAGFSLQELDAVGISQGPGSYTGLRIGYATVKGLCFASGLPLIAIPTLYALASAIEREMKLNTSSQDYCCVPMIDARRMEVYTQTFLPAIIPIGEPCPCILDEEQPQRPTHLHAYYAGSGALKARFILPPDAWTYVEYTTVRAKDLLPILQSRFEARMFEDIAYATPLYVKDFEATPSRRTPLCGNTASLPSDARAE